MDLKKNVYNSTHSKLNKRVKKMKKIIVLNNASEVTDDIKDRILNNDLDVLKVNYNCDCSSPSPFAEMKDLNEINFEIQLGENVQSLFEFFYNCVSLRSIPLFDTSKVTNMKYMFVGSETLETVPLFDTRKVVNMNYMFFDCLSLKTVPQFDTQKVINMCGMFFNCTKLKTVPLFNTQNVINMSNMFAFCESLKSVLLFNTKNVTKMGSMFKNCPAGESQGLV